MNDAPLFTPPGAKNDAPLEAKKPDLMAVVLGTDVKVPAWMLFRALDGLASLSAHHHPKGTPCKADDTLLFLSGLLIGATRRVGEAFPDAMPAVVDFREGVQELLGRRGLTAYSLEPGSRPGAYKDISPGPVCAGAWTTDRPTEADWYMVRGPGFRVCIEVKEIAGLPWPALPHTWESLEGCEFCPVTWPAGGAR